MSDYTNPPRVTQPPPNVGAWMRWVEKQIGVMSRVSPGRVSVTAGDLAGASVTFGAMAPGALDGFPISAPNLQSSPPGSGLARWAGDSFGFHFFDADGNPTIDLNAASGKALITGTLQSELDGVYPQAQIFTDAFGVIDPITGVSVVQERTGIYLVGSAGLMNHPASLDTYSTYTYNATGVLTSADESPFVELQSPKSATGDTAASIRMVPSGTGGTPAPTVSIVGDVSISGNLTVGGVPPSGGGSSAPPGSMMQWAGRTTTIPTGWLLCNGASLLRTDQPALFSAIDTLYGAADGTHFSLPNMQGKVAVGLDPTDPDFGTVGQVSGSKTPLAAPAPPTTATTAVMSGSGLSTGAAPDPRPPVPTPILAAPFLALPYIIKL